VAVVTRDLEAGRELEPGDVELVDRPVAVLPDDVVREDPVGRILNSAVFEGEVLVDGRIADAGQRGVAARLPAGHRAVALPREPGTTPAVEAGQRVDVIVVLQPEQAGDGPPGLVVAADALVVDVAEAAITVAVDADAATRVAVALAVGVVTIALAGG
jgi:Flp pilus assembly protein CpaB